MVFHSDPADLVGGHPHVTQVAEIYRGKPIAYSLGNFIFDGFEPPEPEAARRGWERSVRLDAGGVSAWETRVAAIDRRGTPHPLPGARSPCGKRGDAAPQMCVNH